MLVSALKMKSATEEIISFSVSKSFYHVCRIILEYHMNIIWDNLSFTTHNQKRKWSKKKPTQVDKCCRALNHISCSNIYREVLRKTTVHATVFSEPSSPHQSSKLECWLYPRTPRQLPRVRRWRQAEAGNGARTQVLMVQSADLPGTDTWVLPPLSTGNAH